MSQKHTGKLRDAAASRRRKIASEAKQAKKARRMKTPSAEK